jgi:5-methylcytosine-specific restriction endonuclease McrA
MRMLNDKRWKETKRIVWERAQGLCEWCKRDGYIVAGVDCHHLIPFESAKTQAEMERLCYDPNNCVLLCVEHHRAEHNQKGYHKKENVKARRDQAFERWKERQTKK